MHEREEGVQRAHTPETEKKAKAEKGHVMASYVLIFQSPFPGSTYTLTYRLTPHRNLELII